MNATEQPWIAAGYPVFAYEGPQGLKIERLSRKVKKNKSSFYHLFSDLEIFTERLLQYHLHQAGIIAVKEAECQTMEELISVIIEHKIDLLFNRQLRIHRINKDFEACFVKTNQITTSAIIDLWAKMLNLQDNSYLAELVLRLSLENFYLQITDETLNHEWLMNYFQELQSTIRQLKNSKQKAIRR